MIEVNIHEAKTQLSRLINAVLEGEDVIICRRNKRIARIVPLEKPKIRRELGWGGADGMTMSDDFDKPLDDFADYV